MLERFLHRQNIVSRSEICVGQKILDNSSESCEAFIKFFDNAIEDSNSSCIGNMHET